MRAGPAQRLPVLRPRGPHLRFSRYTPGPRAFAPPRVSPWPPARDTRAETFGDLGLLPRAKQECGPAGVCAGSARDASLLRGLHPSFCSSRSLQNPPEQGPVRDRGRPQKVTGSGLRGGPGSGLFRSVCPARPPSTLPVDGSSQDNVCGHVRWSRGVPPGSPLAMALLCRAEQTEGSKAAFLSSEETAQTG